MAEKASDKQKSVPQRMCVACREMKDKSELLRVVCDKQGNIFVDESGKAQGRGAYICNSVECIERAAKRKCFNKAFSREVPAEVYEAVKQYAKL